MDKIDYDVAIIGTGIGALVIALTSLTAAFTSSEKGQNKFAKIMGVIGSVVDNLTTLLSDLGLKIISVFEDPKQAIIDFKDAITENITNRITSLIDTFGFLGSAIKKVFKRDFKGAMEDAKKAGNSYIDTMTGVKNTVDKVGKSVSGLTDELIREGKIAASIADQRAKATKLERDLIIERAEANRTRAELLEKAVDKEKYNLQERIGFLEEAGRLEEEITNKEIEAAQLRLQAKILENEQANSTTEDLNEEAELKAQLIQLETARLTKAKEVTSQIAGLKAEERAKEKALQDEADRIAKEEKDERDRIAKEARLKREEEEKTAEEERLRMLKENAEKAIQIAEAEAAAKKANLDKTASVLQAFSAIAGEETVAGKAFAVAAATINTYRGVSDALAATTVTPFETALKFANAAAIGIAGIANVKKIISVKTPTVRGGGGGGTQSAPSLGASAPPRPPSFNVVGASNTNQLADAIGGQSQTPTRAYVVSSDVTSAQELDRNIVEGASIG